MTERGDKDNIRIARIHDHSANRARILQANALPGLTSVQRFPHAVALRDVSANASFTGPHVDDIGIGHRNRDTADRRRSILVKNSGPGIRAVGRFPHAATGRAEIVGGRIAGNSGCRKRAAAAKRADRTVLHSPEQRVAFLLVVFVAGRRWRGCGGRVLLRGIQLAVPLSWLGES